MEAEKSFSEAEETKASACEEAAKGMWQIQKENWYDKIPLNLKQLDTIIAVCWIAIVILIVVIALDAMDIFNPFGY